MQLKYERVAGVSHHCSCEWLHLVPDKRAKGYDIQNVYTSFLYQLVNMFEGDWSYPLLRYLIQIKVIVRRGFLSITLSIRGHTFTTSLICD